MMAEEPLKDQVVTSWPVEGHVIVPGSGLVVTRDCLGQSISSRMELGAENVEITIGLPQLHPPSADHGPLMAPKWDFAPNEETTVGDLRWGETKYQHEDQACVFRCRYGAAIQGSYDDLYGETWSEFHFEFEFWWENFTSWAAILASQDLVGPPEWDRRGPDHEAWLLDPQGQRVAFTTGALLCRSESPTFRVLELRDLEACGRAAGNHGSPPVEWKLIRDARSQANLSDEFHGIENLRRAVNDAATALELALPLLLEKYLDDAGVLEPVRKALGRSADDFGGKEELLNLVRSGLWRDRVRLGLTGQHDGANPHGRYSFQEAEAAIDIATAVVEGAYPLGSYLQINSATNIA